MSRFRSRESYHKLPRILFLLIVALSLNLFLRGVDYVTGNSFDVSATEDDLFATSVWGFASLAAVAVTVFGLVSRKPIFLQFGAVASFAIYSMFAIQTFNVRMLPFPWPPEDVRLVSAHLLEAFLWLSVAVEVKKDRYVREKVAEEMDRFGEA